MYHLGRKSRAELAGVHPRLVAVVERAIEITDQDFTVFDGLRTAAEQRALYERGASQRDGYRRKSEHQRQASGFGHAVDLVPWINGRARWEWGAIYPIAAAMRQAAIEADLSLRWGGVWDRWLEQLGPSAPDLRQAVIEYTSRNPGPDFIDGPHYEITGL